MHILVSEKKTKKPSIMRALKNYFGDLKPVHKEWGVIFFQAWDESEKQIRPNFTEIKGVSIFISSITKLK